MKIDELHEATQPQARMKHVWNRDEHVGKTKNRWYTGKPTKAKAYGWSKSGTFRGQSEGYDDHIMTNGHS
ncbi:MAG: hypothetical protein QF535_20280 [Anaerolineales bacterium]|jgi:hypothetical protein|nr:hypothetical protein [Anaerolineales bacterium]